MDTNKNAQVWQLFKNKLKISIKRPHQDLIFQGQKCFAFSTDEEAPEMLLNVFQNAKGCFEICRYGQSLC